MGIKFSNNAIGTLASGIGTGDLTIALTAGQGAKFPTLAAGDYFFARLKKSTNEIEIVKCTARATDTLTVTRGEDGTTPLTFSAGDEIRITWPRAAIEAVRDEARGPSAVEALSGTVALAAADKLKQKVCTASSTITLPPAANINIGDWIDFKSSTTGLVKILPDGADTLDGDAAPAYYRLPAFYECRVMKSAAGTFILARRPQRFVGEVFFYPGVLTTPLKGTLFADNVLESRTTYAGLFDAYGTTHGAGDGTTFGKPDMRDRVPVGRGNMGGADAGLLTDGADDSDTAGFDTDVVGTKGGSEKTQRHTHIQEPHKHTLRGHLNLDNNQRLTMLAQTLDTVAVDGSMDNTTAINQNAFTGQSGNVQPSLVGNWLVQL